jgi:hypothetical protein
MKYNSSSFRLKFKDEFNDLPISSRSKRKKNFEISLVLNPFFKLLLLNCI